MAKKQTARDEQYTTINDRTPLRLSLFALPPLRPDTWDALPPGMEDELDPGFDIKPCITECRARIEATEFIGRNRMRDKSMLRTLALLMEQAGTRVFDVTREDLVIRSGLYPRTAWDAVKSLRGYGYVLCLGEVSGSLKHRAFRLLLVLDALAPLPSFPDDAPHSTAPETRMRRLLSGDYGHDAFAGHKGMKANRREIYLFALRNPGSTRYAISKATRISQQTVRRAVECLAAQELARLDDTGKVEAIEPDREKAALAMIVRNNWTQGKTLQRVEYLERPWYDIKAERKEQRRKNYEGMKDDPVTPGGEQEVNWYTERSHDEADLIIDISTPPGGKFL